MQSLVTEFQDATFTYEQVERQGNLAIYQQTHKVGGAQRYEVVRIRISQEHVWPNGAVSPERETYAGTSRWGIDGWTLYTLDAARAKVTELAQAEE